MNIEEATDTYLKSRRYQKLSLSSKIQYDNALRHLRTIFSGRDISSIRRPEIIRAYDEMYHTPGKASQFVRVSSAFFNYALDMELIQANPCIRVALEKGGNIPRWDVKDIMAVINLRHRVVSTATALAWHTGQREGDILEMKWSDIQDGFIVMTQSKTGTKMKIPVSDDLKEYLESIDKTGEYIVSGYARITCPAFRAAFKRATRGINIDLPFHGIRKTVASVLAEKGATVNEIAAALGHKTLAMAELYTKGANSDRLVESAMRKLTTGSQ